MLNNIFMLNHNMFFNFFKTFKKGMKSSKKKTLSNKDKKKIAERRKFNKIRNNYFDQMSKKCEKEMKGAYYKDVWECAHNLTEKKYPRKPRSKN